MSADDFLMNEELDRFALFADDEGDKRGRVAVKRSAKVLFLLTHHNSSDAPFPFALLQSLGENFEHVRKDDQLLLLLLPCLLGSGRAS